MRNVKVFGFEHGDKVRHHAYANGPRGTVRHTGVISSTEQMACVRWHGTAVEEPLTAHLASLLVYV